jgi:protein O-GlcNAc transferase
MPLESADDLFEQAVTRHEAGQFAEAEALYQKILQAQPNDADVVQLLGMLNSQLGRKDAALDFLRRATVLAPAAPDGHYNLGVVLAELSRHDEAIFSFRQATNLKPDFADAFAHLGVSLRAKNQIPAAVEALLRAVSLRPDFAEAFNNLGTVLRQQNKLDDAINAYRRAVSLRPQSADMRKNLGNALVAREDWTAAIQEFRQAAEIRPDDPHAHFALGNALHSSGQISEGIESYRKAVSLRPDYAEVYANLGDALHLAGKTDEAIAACKQALAIRPDFHIAHNNLANALQAQGKIDDAIASIRQAIALKPDYADALYNLGNILQLRGQLEEAAAAYRRAIRARADFAAAYNNLGKVLKDMRQLDDALNAFQEAMLRRPTLAAPNSNFLYALHYPQNVDPRMIFQEHLQWDRRHARPLARQIRAHDNDRHPDRPLRVGYVSADFRRHSVAYFLQSLLANHDPGQVEVFCYSDTPRADETTARFQKMAAHWRDSEKWSNPQLVETIRQDRIDILVDLSGHGSGSRLVAFACKPAPIQVTYLGYPNTTGLSTMDYRFTDATADPPGQTDAFYTEKLVRFAHTFLCYTPPTDAPQISPLSGDTTPITFGSFNALAKITPSMLATWSRILQAIPNSRMIIKSHSGLNDAGPRQRLLDIFASCGIDPARINLHAHLLSPADHLELYHQIHIALDTFPYHGTATTCEALWMGVPVITLAGTTHVSRVGASLLSNLGLPELIANGPDQYVKIAADLANDRARLTELRRTLRDRMADSLLTDGPLFAREVESNYRRMWRKWIWG